MRYAAQNACTLLPQFWKHVALIDRVQDQKVWSSISITGQVKKCQANFLFHAASAYLAVMGTWWTRIMTEWLKL